MSQVNLKVKALAQAELNRGTLPRDAMDAVQRQTAKEYSRNELKAAMDAAIKEVYNNGKRFEWMKFWMPE